MSLLIDKWNTLEGYPTTTVYYSFNIPSFDNLILENEKEVFGLLAEVQHIVDRAINLEDVSYPGELHTESAIFSVTQGKFTGAFPYTELVFRIKKTYPVKINLVLRKQWNDVLFLSSIKIKFPRDAKLNAELSHVWVKQDNNGWL